MSNNNFSIIWSDSDKREAFRDYTFLDSLNFRKFLNLKSKNFFGPISDISDYFTTDQNTIIYRSQLFSELLFNRSLYYDLCESFMLLSDLYSLKTCEDNDINSNESAIYSIKELELYLDYVKITNGVFCKYNIQSFFLLKLKEFIAQIYNTDEFMNMNEAISRQSHVIKDIQSVTIGANLNSQLEVIEAGIIKVNNKRFMSGSIIDKFLRLDFVDDEFTCLAPLISKKQDSQEEKVAMQHSLNCALNSIFSKSINSWKRTCRKYIMSNLHTVFSILFDWNFICACMDVLIKLNDLGYPLCRPVLASSDRIYGIYSPILALQTDRNKMVLNNCEFDKNRIYILTGPNQGGKSNYLYAIGILYSMLHLGLLLPANSAQICLVDSILVHFSDKTKNTPIASRFAAECEEIQKLNGFISRNSLFLFDEALSSTDADEACIISKEILSAYSILGARGVWATHFHELCLMEKEQNNIGGSQIANLSAVICQKGNVRTYEIKPGIHYGTSYAMDIANKYGLTKNDILAFRVK